MQNTTYRSVGFTYDTSIYKGTCLASPYCPVAIFTANNYSIYAFSYIDNRMSFRIFVIDSSNNVVNSFELIGHRYVTEMEINCTNERLYIDGQSGRVSATFAQLGGVSCTSTASVCTRYVTIMSQYDLFIFFFFHQSNTHPNLKKTHKIPTYEQYPQLLRLQVNASVFFLLVFPWEVFALVST